VNLNPPNLLTAARLFAVPLIIWLIMTGQHGYAFGVFVAAGLTDLVDGYLAKNFNMKTDVGAWLDPLADKVLMVSVFIVLTYLKVIPLWLTVLVIARDVAILLAVGVSYAIGHEVKFKPIWISKINTALQVLLIGFVLLLLALDRYDTALVNLACYIVAATTIASWLQYFVMWLRATMAKPRNSA
jgi:cardiolipin synthase